MNKKICTKCNIIKDTNQFYKLKTGKFGVDSKCKECKSEYEKNKNVEYNPNEFKVCKGCNIKKTTTDFHKHKSKKFGVDSRCKQCKNQYEKNRNNQYDPNAIKLCGICKIEKPSTKFNKNKAGKFGIRSQCKQCQSEFYQNNKECINYKQKRNNYTKQRRKSDPLFKLKCNIRNSIRYSLKAKVYGKNTKTIQILGCSYEELKKHIESKFEPWMDWSKYGLYNNKLNYGFDIDHIIPVSSAKTEEEVIKLNHYTNLQPLCSYINRVIKKNKLNY